MKTDINSTHLEIATANYFGFRQNLIVPNVSWGLGLSYEADLLVVRPSGFIEEIEIKISITDLKQDAKKNKWTTPWGQKDFNKMKKFWYCITEDMAKKIDIIYENIPEFAGLLVAEYDENRHNFYISKKREAKTNKLAKKISDKSRLKLAELGCMRIWTLKKHRNNYEN